MLHEMEYDTVSLGCTPKEPAECDRNGLCENPIDILLVEDVASDALLARLALDQIEIPYSLFTVHKGEDFFDRLVKYHAGHPHAPKLPDVILLDLGLPGMDGFEIIDRLKTAPAGIRSVPIIILSSYNDFQYLQRTSNLFIPAYLTKPCHPKQLQEIITRVCGMGRQRLVG